MDVTPPAKNVQYAPYPAAPWQGRWRVIPGRGIRADRAAKLLGVPLSELAEAHDACWGQVDGPLAPNTELMPSAIRAFAALAGAYKGAHAAEIVLRQKAGRESRQAARTAKARAQRLAQAGQRHLGPVPPSPLPAGPATPPGGPGPLPLPSRRTPTRPEAMQ